MSEPNRWQLEPLPDAEVAAADRCCLGVTAGSEGEPDTGYTEDDMIAQSADAKQSQCCEDHDPDAEDIQCCDDCPNDFEDPETVDAAREAADAERMDVHAALNTYETGDEPGVRESPDQLDIVGANGRRLIARWTSEGVWVGGCLIASYEHADWLAAFIARESAE